MCERQNHQPRQHLSTFLFVITYGNIQDTVADGIQNMILNDHLKPDDCLRQIEVAKANSDDAHRRLRLVCEFFFTVLEVSEKEHLLRILSNLRDLSQHYYLYFYSFPELDSQRLMNHHNIYQACHNRNAKAPINAFRIV